MSNSWKRMPAGAGARRPPPDARRAAPREPPTAEAAERAEAAHVVVLLALLGVAEDLVRLGDLLEALGGLGVALVLVRVVLLGELAVLLLDLVLRADAETPRTA